MNSSRCAACKHLRRRCPSDCIFAPYFPSNNPSRFAYVHKIYGASNVGKILQVINGYLIVHIFEERSIYFCSELMDVFWRRAGSSGEL